MTAKCPCQFCGANIEFDTREFLSGDTITCPHCSLKTVLSVSVKTAPAKPERFVLDIRLNSGIELRITDIRLYEERAVVNLNSKMAEATKLWQGVSPGIGAIGSIEWVLAATAVIGAAEAALSASASSKAIRLLQEVIQLERRLNENGVFIPISQILQVEVPTPSLWRGREAGHELIHNGSDFIAVMTDERAPSSIRWSSVERFIHRKIQ